MPTKKHGQSDIVPHTTHIWNKEYLYRCKRTYLCSLVTLGAVVGLEFWLRALGLLTVADGRRGAIVLALALSVGTDRHEPVGRDHGQPLADRTKPWPSFKNLEVAVSMPRAFFSVLQNIIVKNMFGFSILLFTAFNVDDKYYRQVLTQVNYSQLLLKLEILDKFRLVTTHQNTTQRKLQHFLVYTSTRETGVLMTLKHRASM
jgi:hypothetical protein